MNVPVVFVIIGVTGDLARTKLLPAIAALAKGGALSNGFHIIGTTRQNDVDTASLLSDTHDASLIEKNVELFSASFDDREDGERLLARLDELDGEYDATPIRIFHLSVPPIAAQPIISTLASAGFFKDERARLLLEKPFGTDLQSAQDLEEFLASSIDASQLYRVDHYLQKQLSRVLAERRIDLPELSSETLSRIDVIASESKDIGTRAKFYDTVGALRDVLENHLLELTATLLMTAPANATANASAADIPSARLAVLKSLTADPASALHAQYEGYTQETSASSRTETFVGLTLHSSDTRFQNTPIRLVTGKALAEKQTMLLLVSSGRETILSFDRNTVAHEGVESSIEPLPEFDGYAAAYQDAISADHRYFVSKDESLEAWRIVGPVLDVWKNDESIRQYPIGASFESLYPL